MYDIDVQLATSMYIYNLYSKAVQDTTVGGYQGSCYSIELLAKLIPIGASRS